MRLPRHGGGVGEGQYGLFEVSGGSFGLAVLPVKLPSLAQEKLQDLFRVADRTGEHLAQIEDVWKNLVGAVSGRLHSARNPILGR